MNIFVLNTGRCGSMTFSRACQHISNFTTAHESRCGLLGQARFDYPGNHIEVDNRLSWLLGRLDQHYGDTALYVHLKRDTVATAQSFVNRYSGGIIHAYGTSILKGLAYDAPPMSVSLDYCDTVNRNIDLFLKDKTKKMEFTLENAKQDFQLFWELISAEGDRDAALREFDRAYNTSIPTGRKKKPSRIMWKLKRIVVKFPAFLKYA